MSVPAMPSHKARGRLVRFLAVGGGTAAAQFGLLAALKGRLHDTTAYTISWLLATALHYLANRFWAFPSTRHDTGRQFGEYLFTIAVSFVINFGCFRLFHHTFGLDVMWATFWSVPPATIVVFLLLNYRVFRAPGIKRGETH